MGTTIAVETLVIRTFFIQLASIMLAAMAPFAFTSASTTGVVVTGIGGNDQYAEQFLQQGDVIVEALRTISDSEDDIALLQGDAATLEALLQQIEEKAENKSDTFFLVLIGHGAVDAETWRFNLPGKDLSTEDLVAALSGVESANQLVMVGTSASGALLDILDQPGRHVVTATKSAGELNAVRFPEYLAKAMESSVADTDRNEILTLAEVFRYTNEKTQGYYDDQNLLASEHARITGEQPERMAMARLGSLKTARDDPAVSLLLDKRLVLEDEFLALKARKSDMQTQAFYAELEPLLISIAKLQQEIDSVTGWVETNE